MQPFEITMEAGLDSDQMMVIFTSQLVMEVQEVILRIMHRILTVLLGKILRIDVDGGTPYAIPLTNPFYDSTGNVAREIYAWGMRNPWRCSFDPVTGWLWAGDVGQNAWEEIDIIENGKNYGWRCYEGTHTYNTSGCNYPEYINPIWEYGHSPECSITGGYVYRGPSVPELEGKYIYGDYCSSKIWSLEYDGINPPVNQYLLNVNRFTYLLWS